MNLQRDASLSEILDIFRGYESSPYLSAGMGVVVRSGRRHFWDCLMAAGQGGLMCTSYRHFPSWNPSSESLCQSFLLQF